MNCFSFLIVGLMLLATASSLTFGQTSIPVSIAEQPRIAPGRPTLKQRSPRPDTPMANGSGVSEKLLDREESQEDLAADSLNNRKAIHIEFEGLHAFSDVDMIKAFRERGIGFPKTTVPSSESLGRGVALIKELLESRGHFQARVDTRHDEQAGTVVFLVDEGQRLGLAEVRFEGNRSFSSQELRSTLEMYLAHYPRVREGYDSNVFDYCARSLLNFMRSQGYLQATFGEPTKSIDGRGLILTIPLNEGVIYRLGEITIKGTEAVAPDKIRAMLNLRQGDIVGGDFIGKWLFEDLKKTYGELGYIEYTAEADPEFKAATNAVNEGVVHFTVTIEEGRQFRLHAIRFQGTNLPDKEMLGLLRIQAGDIFNHRLFEESIHQLNQSGRFEPIDKDRDTDFRTNAEEALIDVVIKVSNKGDRVSSTHRQL